MWLNKSKENKKGKSNNKKQSKTDEQKKKKNKNYHVSKNEDGKWQVKFAGGEKAIKLFDTQAEAIDYAKQLAKNQDGNITIHKRDGKLRKQKYWLNFLLRNLSFCSLSLWQSDFQARLYPLMRRTNV